MKKFFYISALLLMLPAFYVSVGSDLPDAKTSSRRVNAVEPRKGALRQVAKQANTKNKKTIIVPNSKKNVTRKAVRQVPSLKENTKLSKVDAITESQQQKTIIPSAVVVENKVVVPEKANIAVPEKRIAEKPSTREIVRPLANTELIDTSEVLPISSVDFSKGDPFDRLPFKTSEYYHFAKDQDLKELIRNFCTTQGIDVILSDKIVDVVNGKFSNVDPKRFWRDIVSAYGLVWFYDGSMMYVYKSHEVSSQVFQMSHDEIFTLAKVILQLDFCSSNFSFRPLEKAGILVVSAPPKLMSLVSELSKKIIVERVSDFYDIKSFPLKNAWAYDMSVNYRGGSMNIPGVASMLQQIIGALPGPLGQTNLGVGINNLKTAAANPMKDLHEPNNIEQIKASKIENASESTQASGPEEKSPLSLGEIFITYDTRLNAVIVKAKRQDMSFIEKIIQQLDVPRNAIKIDVAVVDISKSGTQKVGASLGLQGPDSTKTRNVSFSQNFSDTSTSPSFNLCRLFKGYSLDATLDILENVGNAQTLTRSSVITLDNIGAVIDRSNTQYVQVTGSKTQGLYDVTVSTKLVVVPHLIPDEFDAHGVPKIKLLVEVMDGSFEQSPLPDAKAPTTCTNSVNTEAAIYEGQSLFIGGYFHELHKVASKGVPGLKDLPLLGKLFKSDSDENTVVERIYIITPSVVSIDDPKNLQLNRFFTDSQLSGKSTLSPEQFNLTNEYNKPDFHASGKEEIKNINGSAGSCADRKISKKSKLRKVIARR